MTEVKAGQFAALDCGANPEAWSEIFVQLWDVIDGDRTHMKAGKFAAIIRKVSEHVGLDQAARLTFEVSDGVAPMQLHCAASPILSADRLTVALAPRGDGSPARPGRVVDGAGHHLCARRGRCLSADSASERSIISRLGGCGGG